MLRRVFQAEDEREHRDERERRACEIDPAGARVAILGQERRAEDESSIITGTASKNTEPHQKYWSSAPPSSGPIAAPAE